jgi:hypothetical protein
VEGTVTAASADVVTLGVLLTKAGSTLGLIERKYHGKMMDASSIVGNTIGVALRGSLRPLVSLTF